MKARARKSGGPWHEIARDGRPLCGVWPSRLYRDGDFPPDEQCVLCVRKAIAIERRKRTAAVAAALKPGDRFRCSGSDRVHLWTENGWCAGRQIGHRTLRDGTVDVNPTDESGDRLPVTCKRCLSSPVLLRGSEGRPPEEGETVFLRYGRYKVIGIEGRTARIRGVSDVDSIGFLVPIKELEAV